MLEAISIYKSYKNLDILKGINLYVDKKEIISIVGASGAGKSTLLHILGTLDKPNHGVLKIIGKKVFDLTKKKLSLFRNENIGFVFQFHNLLPEFTAMENVCLPAFIGGKNKLDTKKKAEGFLTLIGMRHRMEHKPSELSGGEQQRVSIARALINDAPIIFADEPTGNLDSTNAEELHQLFFKVREELGTTFVIVTHNSKFAFTTDRILTIKDGKISN